MLVFFSSFGVFFVLFGGCFCVLGGVFFFVFRALQAEPTKKRDAGRFEYFFGRAFFLFSFPAAGGGNCFFWRERFNFARKRDFFYCWCFPPSFLVFLCFLGGVFVLFFLFCFSFGRVVSKTGNSRSGFWWTWEPTRRTFKKKKWVFFCRQKFPNSQPENFGL